jgi:hypothetical protein
MSRRQIFCRRGMKVEGRGNVTHHGGVRRGFGVIPYPEV